VPETPRRRILVVDDEPRMVRFIRLNLEQDGFDVMEARTGMEALSQLRLNLPDLVLLDVMLPDIDGLEILRMIREFSQVPILMVTARGEEDDRVKGLERGADDYIAKPFSPRELASRIRAVLRRNEMPRGAAHEPIVVDDRLTIDFDKREVRVEGKPVVLRPTEYRLLFHLVQNAGRVVTHDQLLAKVWGYEYREETHYLRLYVNYLRQKLERDPSKPEYILTERGVGYRFMELNKPGEKNRGGRTAVQAESAGSGT
jgi:DNA-binding response OmpR family regulator